MPAPKRPTAWSEAKRLLDERGPMHYRDLADAILADGNVTIKGKTFKQTLSATLSRKAQTGEDVLRVAPGVYRRIGGPA
jgi:hypothetical protein